MSVIPERSPVRLLLGPDATGFGRQEFQEGVKEARARVDIESLDRSSNQFEEHGR